MSQQLNPLRLFQIARTAGFQQSKPVLRMTFPTANRSVSTQIYQQIKTGLRSAPRYTARTAPNPRFRPFAQRPRRPFSSTSGRFRSSKEGSKSDGEPQTLGARLKQLTKEYGWVTVAVYLGLSALDFPFCFLLVRVAGPEKIGKNCDCSLAPRTSGPQVACRHTSSNILTLKIR